MGARPHLQHRLVARVGRPVRGDVVDRAAGREGDAGLRQWRRAKAHGGDATQAHSGAAQRTRAVGTHVA
eukprot:776363-Prymnesium_polylepis.1